MNQSQLPGIDILLIITVAAVLIGIVFYTRRPPKIRVGKSNITAQDSASILKLFADDTKSFDFRVKEDAAQVTVALHTCTNRKWAEPVSLADFTDLESGKYRLIIRRVGTIVDIYLCSNADYTRVVHITSSIAPEYLDALSECRVVGQFELSDCKAAIGNDSRTPLWVLLGRKQGTLTVTQDYQHSGGTTGFAIILQFR